MQMFIYFYSKLGTPRDEIEDLLQEYLGQSGEVTGGGAGQTGSNIDLEIFEDDNDHLQGVRAVLRQAAVPADTVIVVEGKRYAIYD